MDPTLLNKLIAHRRSIYPALWNDKPVSREIIEQILENARWAPNHAQTQPWHYVIFTGSGKEKLANFQAELYKKNALEQGIFKESKYNDLLTKPLRASHIIAIGAKKSGKVPEIEDIEAVACSVQNMYLTAAAYGIGCYWGSGGITYLKEANSFFGLEIEDTLLGFLFIAHYDQHPESKRDPIEGKVTWIE